MSLLYQYSIGTQTYYCYIQDTNLQSPADVTVE